MLDHLPHTALVGLPRKDHRARVATPRHALEVGKIELGFGFLTGVTFDAAGLKERLNFFLELGQFS